MAVATGQRLSSLALIAVGIVHLVPAAGMTGTAALETLYGTAIAEPNLEILMRHRAVLFALLGAFLIAAAFRPALAPMALLAGIASVGSYLVLAWTGGGYNEALARVVRIDIVALGALLLAVAANTYARRA